MRDFELSKFIVCTDAGLSSDANRKFNNYGERNFITTQSIKKLKNEDKTRLDSSISILEEALKSGDEYRIKTASEDLDTILRSVGTYTSAPEGGNDDGAYDV